MFSFSCDIWEGKKRSKSDGSDSGEENMSKKDLALQQAMDQITSTFGKGSIMWLGRTVSPKNVPVVSTGSFALDIALGIFGLPKVYLHLFLLWYLNQHWTFLFLNISCSHWWLKFLFLAHFIKLHSTLLIYLIHKKLVITVLDGHHLLIFLTECLGFEFW